MASPDDSIVIAGEVTRADFDAIFKWKGRRLSRRARLHWLEMILVGGIGSVIFLLAAPIVIIAIDGEQAATAGMFSALYGMLVGGALVTYQNFRLSRRVRGLNRSGIGRFTFRFGHDGLTVEKPSTASAWTPWSAITRLDVAPRHLVFWQDDLFAQDLPRAIIGGPAKEAELLAAIRRWAPYLASPHAGTNKSA